MTSIDCCSCTNTLPIKRNYAAGLKAFTTRYNTHASVFTAHVNHVAVTNR